MGSISYMTLVYFFKESWPIAYLVSSLVFKKQGNAVWVVLQISRQAVLIMQEFRMNAIMIFSKKLIEHWVCLAQEGLETGAQALVVNTDTIWFYVEEWNKRTAYVQESYMLHNPVSQKNMTKTSEKRKGKCKMY